LCLLSGFSGYGSSVRFWRAAFGVSGNHDAGIAIDYDRLVGQVLRFRRIDIARKHRLDEAFFVVRRCLRAQDEYLKNKENLVPGRGLQLAQIFQEIQRVTKSRMKITP
jgi:hypothetical protein